MWRTFDPRGVIIGLLLGVCGMLLLGAQKDDGKEPAAATYHLSMADGATGFLVRSDGAEYYIVTNRFGKLTQTGPHTFK